MEKLNLLDLLNSNPYPGRGIVLGKSADGGRAVAVYSSRGGVGITSGGPHLRRGA